MKKSVGYSGRALVDKLGLKSGFRIKCKNIPTDYFDLISPVPPGAIVSTRLRSNIDVWHLFTTSRVELESVLKRARREITINGMIWVSWPKKSSGVPTEVTENTIREIALPMGLVDVKVCAVDSTWSGLKLVIRKELRTK